MLEIYKNYSKIMKKTTFLIVGKHAVLEALKNPSRKVERVFVTDDAQKRLNRENQSLNLFGSVSVFYKSKRELDNMCGKDETSHQGLVAEVEQLEDITLKEYILNNENKNLNLLALEEVTDPRNIGSIIRSAVAFNIDGLIVKERSFPHRSKLLYKSASGGTEHLKIFRVSNINSTLRYLKTKNFWVSAFDVKGTKDFTRNNWKGKNVLLFGSEGFGLKEKTIQNADFQFKVQMSKKIDSLNISNTVTIVCHHIFNSIKNENFKKK